MKKKSATTDKAGAKPVAKLVVRIEDKNWREETAALRLLRRAAKLAMASVGANAAEATILLSDDARLKGLNDVFRGKQKPTNVLSFPSDEPGYLGDIAIAFGVVAREARAQRKTFSAHAAHLAVHGILHLAGYDHDIEKDATKMENMERDILARLGIEDPYLQSVRQSGKAA